MITAFPSVPWYEHLPDILAGLRFLPNKLGYSAYLLRFKQEPTWLGECYAQPGLLMEVRDQVTEE